uniref:Uncharacterized protein n=1 Tax=Anguilla anguilla TaxID=7936 RepID=A0A0E9Q2C8_ANGAN
MSGRPATPGRFTTVPSVLQLEKTALIVDHWRPTSLRNGFVTFPD